MPPFLAEVLSQMKAIWARLDAGQRLTIGAVLTATVAGLVAIVWFAGRPDYHVVRTSADLRERARITSALDQAGITYKFDGNSVTVETAVIDAARRALTSAGIGGGGSVGDPGQLASMTSDRASRMHMLGRQMEQDAELKIFEITGVTHAQVSHSKPKRSPYRELDHETQPRANVGLHISPGANFAGIAKVAIQEAAAALGVPPEYVTVTNLGNMQVYGGGAEASGSLDTAQFLEQQYRRSEELTGRAQSLLDRLYPDKALVRVTVVLDPEWRTLRERSAPDKQLIVRTVSTKENSTDPGKGGDPSGNPAVGTASVAGSGHKKESKETEYSGEGYKETSSGRLAPDIRKMTVALVVDETIAADANKEQELQALVKSAIGWSDEWGGPEAFTLHKTSIPELALPEGPALPGVFSQLERWGPAVGQVVAVILVLLFLRRLLKKSSAPRAPKASSPQGNAEEIVEEALSPEEQRHRMRRDIERAIADDPATVSRMLESWLTETAK